MALNIKNATAHELARKLAERRGTTLTRAVTDALAEALERNAPAASPKLNRLREIANRSAKLPVLDTRTPEEVLGFDDSGMSK